MEFQQFEIQLIKKFVRVKNISVLFLFLFLVTSISVSNANEVGKKDGIVRSEVKDSSVESLNPLARWSLNSCDTKINIAIGADQKLYIYQLKSAADGWNWTPRPSLFPLIERLDMDGVKYSTNWVYLSGTIDKKDGTRLTITFKNESPALELKSVWQAHKGPGPIHHAMFIKNNSGKMITIYEQESFELHVAGPDKQSNVVYISDDRGLPDETGVYRTPLTDNYTNTLQVSENQDWIPFLALETKKHGGMYFGWEWSVGRMAIKADGVGGANMKVGNRDDFKTDLYAGETFEVPPGFIGAYSGDLDDAGNSLHKYLFNYSVPVVLKKDKSYPKIEWNAFAATGKSLGSWDPVEKNYYPLIDDITPLGFEEVVIDIGWWSSYGKPKLGHIITDSIDWPSGMEAAAKYAHDRGLRFGLYDNKPELLTSESGIKERIREITYLINNLHADFYRSDMTAGPVIYGTFGKDQRAHYAEDVDYWSTKGLYDVLNSVQKSIPSFSWENCSGGGGIKDYGVLKIASKIFSQDTYFPINARRSFYDSSHILHSMQLACETGSSGAGQLTGSVYEFRSSSLGAFYWFPDAPNGGNGGPVWTAQHKADIKKAVETYKHRIRPLIRNANVYHIFPRPDDVVWDGVEYYDPASKKGVVYIFKPNSTINAQRIKLKGLNPKFTYKLTFEDGTNASSVLSGDTLMKSGVNVSLNGTFISELMFIEKN